MSDILKLGELTVFKDSNGGITLSVDGTMHYGSTEQTEISADQVAQLVSFVRAEAVPLIIAPNVDGRNFYELCQQYRHSREMDQPGLLNTVQTFNNLREYVKTGRLPWPSYEGESMNPSLPEGK